MRRCYADLIKRWTLEHRVCPVDPKVAKVYQIKCGPLLPSAHLPFEMACGPWWKQAVTCVHVAFLSSGTSLLWPQALTRPRRCIFPLLSVFYFYFRPFSVNPDKSQWISSFWNTQAGLSAPTNIVPAHSNHLSSACLKFEFRISSLLSSTLALHTIKPPPCDRLIRYLSKGIRNDDFIVSNQSSHCFGVCQLQKGFAIEVLVPLCFLFQPVWFSLTPCSFALLWLSRWRVELSRLHCVIQILECSLIGWLEVCSSPKGESGLTLAPVIDF